MSQTFDAFIGTEHVEADGFVSAKIEIQPHHRNPTGNINGGVIISIADNLSTGAANRAYSEKTGEHSRGRGARPRGPTHHRDPDARPRHGRQATGRGDDHPRTGGGLKPARADASC